MASSPRSSRGVFVNCPFDDDYEEPFNALVFTVYDCGFFVRCAKERDPGDQRFLMICQLIRDCRYGIHDISRTGLDKKTKLPRFNMPLELGVFLGSKIFAPQSRKACLVMDSTPYRYQKFCSDLSGIDIKPHKGSIKELVRVVRNWLRMNQPGVKEVIPAADHIYERYQQFKQDRPEICRGLKLKMEGIIFIDYIVVIQAWLDVNDWRES